MTTTAPRTEPVPLPDPVAGAGRPERPARPTPSRQRHAAGFWIVAGSFLSVMAFAAVPAPLYALYQARDGFPTFTVTLVFAAYAVGVMIALWLAGHLSDVHGRRRLILVSVALELVAAVLFLVWNDVPGLLVARFISGLGVGTLTASATAHLGELRVRARRDGGAGGNASVVAGAVNLGGIGGGALVGGVLAEFVRHPLVVPYAVFVVVLAVAFVAMLVVPETIDTGRVRPAYRPQPITAPSGAAGPFWAAGAGAFSTFAVLGLFTSIAPTFLATTFHVTDRLAAGATSFGVFAGAAVAQIALARLAMRAQVRWGMLLVTVGLAGVAVGALVLVVAVFVVGSVLAGAGVGLLFRASIAGAGSLVGPERRGGVLAATFLIGYAGMVVPVVLAGAVLLVVAPLPVLLGFVVVVIALALWAGSRLAARA
ncbi:MFS transporter [Curtobacterium sp. MCBD17_028]|uniref:MFS transporter n=1 Tax=Curtobacterium sp. MCBD17_028 TaxID=2175670 RepID=UPI000DA974EC|nr:MFS transporter [Curtobacterium sp. MCBD17_028]PZE28069.1 MFS transporter [Curtobacterium sp. MCBD17_028]